MLTKQEIIKKQQRSENKKVSTQPTTTIYKKSTPYGNITLSSKTDGANSTQYKINLSKDQSGKDNSGSKGSRIKESIQKINNYRRINQKEKEQNESEKATNSKEIDHKKWGIRKRQADSTPSIPPKESNKIIMISNQPKYQSKTSQMQPNKYTSNSNSKTNINISGSSQSNYVITDGNTNMHQSNYTLKTEPSIKINSTKKTLVNKKQLTSPVLRSNDPSKKSTSLPSNHMRNNTVSHSIVDIKKSPKKPYVLHERKCDVIRHEVKYKIKYNNSNLKGEDKPVINSDNHTIFVTKNVTKELKTIADVPNAPGNKYHRYNYNYNPNISNTVTHSIDATRKKPKKEIVIVPRKNEIIKSTKPHRKINNIESNHEVYKAPSTQNLKVKTKYNVNVSKDNKNKNEPRNKNVFKYEPKNIKNDISYPKNKYKIEPKKVENNVYQPKIIKYNQEPINKKTIIEPKNKYTSLEPKNKYTAVEPKNTYNTIAPKNKSTTVETKTNVT